ncbi:MAG: TldD/PmbA family protein [Spirochaetes bacterium]|nr:TldD/PmbA family protein [Spirochaetota bacterium]
MIDDALIRWLQGTTRWFDIIEVSGESDPVSFKNNRVHSLQFKQNLGYGVRVNIQGTTGFSHTNDPSGLKLAAERAVAMAAFGEREDFELPPDGEVAGDPYDPAIGEYDVRREMEKGEEVIAALRREFPAVTLDLGMSRTVSTVRLVNSRGFDRSYRSSQYSAGISLTHVFPDGSKVDIWEGFSSQRPEPLEEPAARLREKLAHSLRTASCSHGRIPVLFTPRSFARLIGILLSGLNGKSVYKGISPFTEKLGARLFSPSLTIEDDPTLPGSPYSFPFDDEGVPAARKYLVREGTIATFITDLKYASLLKTDPTGNASRGYSTLPAPSYSSVLIREGTTPMAGMLRGMKKGILVDQLIGLGQSNTLTGDFSGMLDLAFLVENGEIAGRIKDSMITDNIFSLLAGEFALSRERLQSGSMLAPWALFPSVNYSC